MYRQAIMEEEQGQIVKRLGKLPIVHDACNEVLDIYERTKGRNYLFRTYFGVAEYMTKAIVGTASPVIYNCFQNQIDRVNDYAVDKLDEVEGKFPIITSPTDQIIQEGKENLNHYWSYIEPVATPAVAPAKLALKASYSVGKTAVKVGTTVASTAMLPVTVPLRVGTRATSAVVRTSLGAAGVVARTVWEKGQEAVYSHADATLVRQMEEQMDETLDVAERLLNKHCLPADLPADRGEPPANRTERVCRLATRIQQALYLRAEGDMVRFRMMISRLLQEIMEVVSHSVTLTRDFMGMLWQERYDIMDNIDLMWNKRTQFLPDLIRPVDPVKRMQILLGFIFSKLSSILTVSLEVAEGGLKGLTSVGHSFITGCLQLAHLMVQVATQTKDFVTGAWTRRQELMDKVDQIWNEIVKFLPRVIRPTDPMHRMVVVLGTLFNLAKQTAHTGVITLTEVGRTVIASVMQWTLFVGQSSSAVLHWPVDQVLMCIDAVRNFFVVEVPVEMDAVEMEDVAMRNCQGMGVLHPVPHLGNSVN